MTTPAGHEGNARIPVRVIGEGELIWSLTSSERLGRMVARLGVTDFAAWNGEPAGAESCLLISADFIYSQVLLADLLAKPGVVLMAEGRPVAAHVAAGRAGDAAADIAAGRLERAADLDATGPEELSSAYDERLRKRELPYVMRLAPETLRAAEERTFRGSYKGVTDFVTLWLWPRPAIAAVRWCASAGITPNMVTAFSLVLVLIAMWQFWHGAFITGLLVAWFMTFLDTVDGKLARVTVSSTPFGNVFDHGIDLIHPPFWYWAWAAGVASTTGTFPVIALWITVIGYVVQRLQEGIFIKRFGMEMHIWRRFDSLWRLVVARRNPNLALLSLFALAGRPGAGLIAVAIWTMVSLIVHSLQIVQASRAPQPLRSWLAR